MQDECKIDARFGDLDASGHVVCFRKKGTVLEIVHVL